MKATIYPETLEQKLGFDKIRQRLEELCISPMGREYVGKMGCLKDFEKINQLHLQTREMMLILGSGDYFPQSNYHDLRAAVSRLKVEGTFLQLEEWPDFIKTLKTYAYISKYLLEEQVSQYPQLSQLLGLPYRAEEVIRQLDRVFDDKGAMKDKASVALFEIRQQLQKQQSELLKRVEHVVRGLKKAGMMEEDASPTIRSGRLVIPVPAEYKRKVRGFVVDESSTGQTAYLEPSELLEYQNDLRELELAERREVQRILLEISDSLRSDHVPLLVLLRFLGVIDFILAKAKLAHEQQATIPVFVKDTLMNWMQARHPVLQRSLSGQGKSIVPLNIQLKPTSRLLVISGPNAGGKSVALKTMGLLQYMLQCGLAVPMSADSTCGVFQEIMLDIGDEQNIEDDLSTYSSHLLAMKHFIEHAGEASLILIDEMGSGTAPDAGGALAEAILNQLALKKAWGAVTTHYDNLKTFADKSPGIQNASMRYDPDGLRPLFVLDIGKPGSSFALEIAQNTGLPTEVLSLARKLLGQEKVSLEEMLLQLEKEKTSFEVQNKLLAQQLEKAKADQVFFTEMKKNLKERQQEIIKKAKEDARILLSDTNKKIEQTIREIREGQAEKTKTKSLREELKQFEQNLITPTESSADEVPELLPLEKKAEDLTAPLAVGDFVKLIDRGNYAKIEAIEDRELLVSMGQITSRVKKNRVVKVSSKEFKEETGLHQEIKRGATIDLFKKMETFSTQVDFRGKRGEEVMSEIHRMMDTALLLGTHELRIVHGKGDGVLRKLIRSQLKSYPQVVAMTDEHADRGGDGVTLVSLKS